MAILMHTFTRAALVLLFSIAVESNSNISTNLASRLVRDTLNEYVSNANLLKRDINFQLGIAVDFPDPSAVKYNGAYYAFATNSKNINTQVATSSNFITWNVLSGYDALPDPGTWTTATAIANWKDASVWAPNVIQNDEGEWVLYYSASSAANPALHCVGVAVSSDVQGPYIPVEDQPLICPLSQGGAIDASGFTDVDGSRWIVYKIDANSLGGGGSCGNTVAPIMPTPIMLQSVAGDGYTLVGSPIELLERSPIDGPVIEAPALTRTSGGQYVLFFSSNCFDSVFYDISYAVASAIEGPYIRSGPFATYDMTGLQGPGGADVPLADSTQATQQMVFHAGPVGSRFMYTSVFSTT